MPLVTLTLCFSIYSRIVMIRYCDYDLACKLKNMISLQSNRPGTSRMESRAISLSPAANTRTALFTVARTQASLVENIMLFTQISSTPIVKLGYEIRNSRTMCSSSRTTLLFVAITSILVLSWVPYWLDIFAEIYVGRIGRHMVYLNNCTNFLLFAMNPTLKHKMAQVIKRLICCRAWRAWVSVIEELTPNITISHSEGSCRIKCVWFLAW